MNFPKYFLLILAIVLNWSAMSQQIPLPEHPRPDFQRNDWINLNGYWDFQFDSGDQGLEEGWQNSPSFDRKILVPFPWGSPLSEVDDEADIAWYKRTINVPNDWSSKRTFLNIGASDWETTVWLEGQLIGKHQGGYIPCSFELTDHLNYGQTQNLVVRVDDVRRDFTLYGKQGYGNARGIWQTVYLESRGQNYLDAIHFSPDIDHQRVHVAAYLPSHLDKDLPLEIEILDADNSEVISKIIDQGAHKIEFDFPIKNQKLWSLTDPHLYDVRVKLADDEVQTYFGMRKISVVDLPGTDYPYIALNNEPIYLQLALDQSYHPQGFYTFPSDQFMREEIERSKSIGLNGIRTHIKIDIPRKLYWADRLGLLVMADLPNSWGEPDRFMRAESEYTLHEMIKRDYNHPSIFSWIVFNETWGLTSKVMENGKEQTEYLPETMQWVASMYHLAKSLDPTRLVEDNSICCGRGHVETDINSWHAYLPGWAWDDHLKELTANTYPGSTFDFEEGFTQGRQPNINSECGNVWGYTGSTGDVDWSYDYHRMINTFRKYPKVAGWLYTEHHDVINEWNGYWRFDRSEKNTGLDEIVPGMTLNDFHAAVYLSTGNEICLNVEGNSTVEIPLYLSAMTGEDFGSTLNLSFEFFITDQAGDIRLLESDTRKVPYAPWSQKVLDPLSIKMPDYSGLGLLRLRLLDQNGNILHRNFMHFVIESATTPGGKRILSQAPDDFSASEWSDKQWNVLDGKKVNGAGSGFFNYTFNLPQDLQVNQYKSASFRIEVSAKELFVKDQELFNEDQDYMKGSRVSPSSNPNSYPMTDTSFFPSEIIILLNARHAFDTVLSDDPADHRGVLSWHHQPKDKTLHEAGSYGYLMDVPISKKILREAIKAGKLEVQIKSTGGGVAIYGKEFGRYPIDPCLVFTK